MSQKKIGAWLQAAAIVAILTTSQGAVAGYDANMDGIPDGVLTYPEGWIYIHLTNQPASHPQCNPSYFVIDPTSMDAGAVNRMFARLMTAYALKESVNIGFDSQGDCVDGYIHVRRIG